MLLQSGEMGKVKPSAGHKTTFIRVGTVLRVVGVISVFAAVAFLVNLETNIPAGYFTLADEIMVIAFAALMYSIAMTVWFHRYVHQNLPSFTTKIDRASFVAVPLVVLALVAPGRVLRDQVRFVKSFDSSFLF
jgi:hypothetical protein